MSYYRMDYKMTMIVKADNMKDACAKGEEALRLADMDPGVLGICKATLLRSIRQVPKLFLKKKAVGNETGVTMEEVFLKDPKGES